MRWLAELSDFNFTVKYRPGKESLDCDYLSRNGINYDEFTEQLDIPTVTAAINSIISTSDESTLQSFTNPSLINHITILIGAKVAMSMY